jgi:hypothetical protein
VSLDGPAYNLHRELSDLLSREDLLTEKEIGLIHFIRKNA